MRGAAPPRARLALLGASALLFLFAIPSAQAQCTTREQIDLASAGYSRAEISNICSGRNAPSYQRSPPNPAPRYQRPAYANYCVTQYGTCPLMQPGAAGGACFCTSAFGVFQGIAQ